MSAGAGLNVDLQGSVLRLTIDRVERSNALTPEMVDEMTYRIVDAERSDIVRVIVISGAGKNFCSGGDLVRSNEPTGGRPRAGHLERHMAWGPHRLMETIHAVQIPIVTVVRGYAAGFGLALAASADYVIADETAVFWSPFVGRGFTPDGGVTWLLPRLVGTARAKDMILRARKVDAKEAFRWGLISELVTEDDLASRSEEVIAEFARAATVAVGLAKSLINQGASMTLSQALAGEAIHEELAVRALDFKIGMEAFNSHSDAEFTGN
jgi:2-(1,2-epoxy-1,2-dihydrophenyl)acetyl-CoA isomerase